jgi:hypothetical protein
MAKRGRYISSFGWVGIDGGGVEIVATRPTRMIQAMMRPVSIVKLCALVPASLGAGMVIRETSRVRQIHIQ